MEYWLGEYDELAQDIESSGHESFALNVQRWLDLIDSHPLIAPHVASWEQRIDFPAWYDMAGETVGSFVGSGRLNWPRDALERLALHFGLMRAFASGEIEIYNFTSNFMYIDGNFDAQVLHVGSNLFHPFQRELRRTLQKLDLSQPPALDDATVPASDRVVRLDHNSEAYRKVVTALENLEAAIARLNDYPSPELKERQVAELSAGRRLLNASHARVAAVWAVLRSPLQSLVKLFAEKEVGHLADQVWKWLIQLLS